MDTRLQEARAAPLEALQEIKNYIGEMPMPFYRKLTQVLIGFEVFSPEEMMAMRIGDEGKYMPDAALAAWAQDSGIDGPIRRT